MKTIRDYTLELAERIKTGKENTLLYINPDTFEQALNGNITSMRYLGYMCLVAAVKCSEGEDVKKEFAELGLYWLKEVVAYDNGEIQPYGQFIQKRYIDVAWAYIYLYNVYYKSCVHGLPPEMSLKDVIPENNTKARHYLWHGVKYGEYCATEWVIAHLKGELFKADVEEAHKYLLTFLEATKNSPRFDRAREVPFFPWRYEDYDRYNHIAVLFQEHGANEYAFELWSELKLLIESQESYDLTPVKVNGAEAIYYNLAWCYCDGIGTTPNHNKAKELFAKAKELYEEENPGEDYLEEDKRADNLAEKLGLL